MVRTNRAKCNGLPQKYLRSHTLADKAPGKRRGVLGVHGSIRRKRLDALRTHGPVPGRVGGGCARGEISGEVGGLRACVRERTTCEL